MNNWIPGKDRKDIQHYRLTPCSCFPPGKDEQGQKLCAWCGQPTRSNRRKYCSPDCADEVGIRAGFLFGRVLQRDNWTCQICGLDCRALKKLLEDARNRQKASKNVSWRDHSRASLNLGIKSSVAEVDHIIPVVEGGGSCGLENLRTVCIWCHRNETKKLAARLAEKRRMEQPSLFKDEGNAI